MYRTPSCLSTSSPSGAHSFADGLHPQTRRRQMDEYTGLCWSVPPPTGSQAPLDRSLSGLLDPRWPHSMTGSGRCLHLRTLVCVLCAQLPSNVYICCLHTKLIYFNAYTHKSFTSKSSSFMNKFIIFIHILSQKLGVSLFENSILHLSFMCGKIVNQQISFSFITAEEDELERNTIKTNCLGK